jgi:hypothetical protein
MLRLLASAALTGALCWPVTSFASADYTERAVQAVSVERLQPKPRLGAALAKPTPDKPAPAKSAPVRAESLIAWPTNPFAPLFLALGGKR